MVIGHELVHRFFFLLEAQGALGFSFISLSENRPPQYKAIFPGQRCKEY
jgi:hypothetical protein